MPAFSTDDVLDYVVREAIVAKVAEYRKKQEKEQERKEFRSSHKDLRGAGTAAWQQEMTANG
jgi:hypothetical protein